MEKYFELAEKLSKEFLPDVMCQILGGATEKQINEMFRDYGIK